MELKPEELEAKNTADQQWLAGINSSYISCRGSFIGLKHTTIAKMFRRCEECIELRSAVIAQAAEIARLTGEVETERNRHRAWTDYFQTNQLTHAASRLESAEDERRRLKAQVAELEAELNSQLGRSE